MSVKPTQQTIGFIGAGNMASAIAKGLVKSGHDPKRIILSNPGTDKLNRLSTQLGVNTTQDNQKVCDHAEIVLLAIKPQQFASVLKELDFSQVDCVISVAAGITVSRISGLIGSQTPVIRSMPNTPAMELAGATGIYAAPSTRSDFAPVAEYIFSAVGRYVWVNNESLMNSVTAIAGSAPAYFFHFVEALIAAGVSQGLSAEDAQTLVVQTAQGAATMMTRSDDASISELRQAVTSPGGTTAAALDSLDKDQFTDIIGRAIAAAVSRGETLAAAKP